MTDIKIKRIYEPADPADGFRVLVDRLWPRGISKERADLDEWAKDIAPSTELRKWYGHVLEKFREFKKKYRAELDANPALKTYEEKWSAEEVVTLLYAAKDETHNEATVLQEYLDNLFQEQH